jgi:hypothetical protein
MFYMQIAADLSLKFVYMRSAQKIVLEGNNINMASRTQLKQLDKNFEFTLLILLSLFHFQTSSFLPSLLYISTQPTLSRTERFQYIPVYIPDDRQLE